MSIVADVLALNASSTTAFDLKRILKAVINGEKATSFNPSFDPATGFACGKPFSTDYSLQMYINRVIKNEFPDNTFTSLRNLFVEPVILSTLSFFSKMSECTANTAFGVSATTNTYIEKDKPSYPFLMIKIDDKEDICIKYPYNRYLTQLPYYTMLSKDKRLAVLTTSNGPSRSSATHKGEDMRYATILQSAQNRCQKASNRYHGMTA